MAREDKDVRKANKRIQSLATGVQDNIDSLYKTTYFSTPQAGNDVNDVTAAINRNIDSIVNRNMSSFGMPSVSVLYQRLMNQNGDVKSAPVDGLNKMFEDPMVMDELYSTFMSNRFIRELDNEIDTVCKYMPRLEEALNTKKDSVLSADHFSKDFLNIKFPTDIANEDFAKRIKELKKKYKLQKLAEEVYQDTAKYGERFVYCVPYKTALARLLLNKPKTSMNAQSIRTESQIEQMTLSEAMTSFREEFNRIREGNEYYYLKLSENECVFSNNTGSYALTESGLETYSKDSKMPFEKVLETNEKFNIGIEINNTGIIDSAIMEATTKINAARKTAKSLKESFAESTFKFAEETISEADNKPEASGNLNFNNVLKHGAVNDGLITGDREYTQEDLDKMKVRTLGAVVKKLKRDRVIPVYIEESCLGYYYIEVRSSDMGDDMMGFRNLMGDPLTNMGSDGRTNFNNVDKARQDDTIKYVAGQLSKFIDSKFINANQDLAKEIYEILKYNDLFNTPSIDMIKVTFIPPEDITHSYFTFDEDSHRGISDFARGLIPAKLYSSLYITNTIGVMTRGQDKRVYYVKQSVDSNIASQLMNVINQIKMGNFGIRQFNSINNVLNITGKFNDYVIPQSQSGDSPINVDVIQGQQFDVHTDLMDRLEEMAINSTEVPFEIIQTRQSIDYAMQLSMSSSKFLRTVYKRQERYQEIMSPLITNIYNYEYGENVELEVTLPPPVFLDMANTNQLINNTKEFVDSIIDVEMQDEQDAALKSKYRDNLFMQYIGTHIDVSMHKAILEKTKAQLKTEQKESEIAQAETPEDSGW